ncbi:P-loop containing nucleoside triphosphate hydrolase protein [Rhizodiscina lignyota]|uniref:DNA 3'-5' helicase n=1 Tax=Rhizodiscina lignyota TaxID=1504668 RepID=A0A9P4IM34_9PEZI|nr:P-loop containing nucleoside triphosphate hydrolase protein [Rhizodiscina lignyota]
MQYGSYCPQMEDVSAVGGEMQYDAYDLGLLQQPVIDRRTQAAEGRARLTLPHSASQAAPRSFVQPTQRVERDTEPIEPARYAPSHFTYDGGLVARSSSSQNELASSPAYKANERRHHYFGNLDHQLPQENTVNERYQEDEERHVADTVPQRITNSLNLPHAPRMLVQGIELVSTHELPDRFRAIFPFPVFNAIQSKSFKTAFQSNDNLVLSSPTGSGKTAVLELAVCRTANIFPVGQYKIVYQAPTKALCAERQRDWQKKFGSLGLDCAELTGDSNASDLKNVQSATIIITTPEKWDSMTRKWKDHEKLMQLVRLCLIDEVHILKEARGATLEAVVSRMKSIGSQIRFVALSATVPNSEDIATWLGKDPNNQHLPAVRERFGEEFRPVKLQKHVCGFQSNGNDFAFDQTLSQKLPNVIAKYSHRKPVMVFCATRQGTQSTAKLLAEWWAKASPMGRYWEAPRKRIKMIDPNLQDCVDSAVAFHHAGLELADRHAVETAFLEGSVSVICCTSTLAVGVNLPCHFVVIKNTVTYAGGVGMKEYADLEVMQMLGRAGRPQFDDSAVAVIMTRQEKVRHYEKMVSGQEVLESCLHLNLTDHLNAEIGLGTITDAYSAKTWLTGTFLYVRMKQNQNHYRLEGDIGSGDLDERLDRICNRDIELLQEYELVTSDSKLETTEYGGAMARYYVNFATMKVFMDLPPKAKVSDILAALSKAAEFQELRFRAGEKSTYKILNDNPLMRYRIPVDLALSAHKVSLIIQTVLSSIDFPDEEKSRKHRAQYNTEVAIIFQHVHRLIRCIIDCQIQRDDPVSARNALMLARSLGARVWDDSPLHMKQIEGIGPITVRKFVNANIKTIEDLERMESHRIEGLVSRNPPFGAKLIDKCRAFPKLRISLSAGHNSVSKRNEGVILNMKAEIGFLNEIVPVQFNRKAVYVCFLAESSDGRKLHFCRISAKKLDKGQDILFSALLTSSTQSVTCYVMCDDIAGTMREASVQPKLPLSMFPAPKLQSADDSELRGNKEPRKSGINNSHPRNFNVPARGHSKLKTCWE